MAKNKKEEIEIDEKALLLSIYERDNNSPGIIQPVVQEKLAGPEPKPEPELPEPAPEQPELPKKEKEAKEPTKRRRNQVDYSGLFLQRNEFKARSCVYISQRIHNTITEIVRVIADRDVTVGGYIDNVLLQHLEMHRDEINDLYKRERKDLIEF
jgi:hypothetical protein